MMAEMFQSLLSKGVDLEAVSSEGLRAINIADMKEHMEIVKIFNDNQDKLIERICPGIFAN